MANFNLKAIFSADTKDVKKGAKESQEAMNAFDKSVNDTAESLSNVFGGSLAGLSEKFTVFKGGLLTLSGAFKTAAAGSTGLSKALGVLKVALISTGIGAIAVALGTLAAYFTKTQQGADGLSRALAPIKVLFANIVDLASAVGEKIVWAFKNPKEAISEIGKFLKDQIVNRLQGIMNLAISVGGVLMGIFTLDKDEIMSSLADVEDAFKQTLTGMTQEQRDVVSDKLNETASQIRDRMKESVALADRSAQLEKEKIKLIKTQADLNKQISELRLKTEDRERYSAEERLQFNREAIKLVDELGQKRLYLAKEEYDIKVAQDSLANNMNEDNQATNELYAQMVDVEKQVLDQKKEMVTKNAELLNQVNAEKKAQEELLKIIQKRNEIVANPLEKIDTSAIPDVPVVSATVKPEVDVEAFQRAQAELHSLKDPVIDLTSTINSGLQTLSVGLGETLGMLISGEGGFKDFANVAISAFADLAIQVGQIAISAGIASLGIKAALESLNGYAAIAAGIALVALGTAVKGALSNVANGAAAVSVPSSYAPGSVIGENSSTSLPNSESKSLEVNVSGRLVASGNQLVAVIESENKRKKLTT